MMQTASIFLSLSIALLAGLLLSRLAKKVQLPAVTAYLIAGILIGPFVLGSLGTQGIGITATQIEGFGIISDLALGFIAFAIGNEFRFLTKIALTKAGDIKEEGRKSAREELFTTKQA